MANRFGGVKGVYFSPTIPIRLLLLISSTNCSGVPKSRSCRSAKGWVLYILNPIEVASAKNVLSALKLIELIVYLASLSVFKFIIFKHYNQASSE
jgi:hypothetical protein